MITTRPVSAAAMGVRAEPFLCHTGLSRRTRGFAEPCGGAGVCRSREQFPHPPAEVWPLDRATLSSQPESAMSPHVALSLFPSDCEPSDGRPLGRQAIDM